MPSTLRPRIRTILVLTGLFFLVTLFFTTSNLFYYLLRKPDEYPLTLWQDFLLYAVRWLPWVFCAPVAIRLARRFPVRGRAWASRLAVLVPAGILLAAAESSLSTLSYRLLFRPLVGLPPTVGIYLNNYWLTGLNYLHNNLVTFLVILIIVWGLDHLRLYREKELVAGRLEAELARANLQALKSQVHPHFLFNTLHMISAMVYEDPARADVMISRLSDFLRATLDSSDAPTVPLKAELDVLSLYLDIMKARFGDRLAVAYEIEPEALGGLVPSFILQPLVENAIKHGIMPRDEGGAITIAASRTNGRLVVGISDDGPGLTQDPDALLDKGLGLKNVKSRLLGLYGPGGVLRIGNRAGGGTRIDMDIPFQTRTD